MVRKEIVWSKETLKKRGDAIKRAHARLNWTKKMKRCEKCGVFWSEGHVCKDVKEKQRNAKLLNPTKHWLGKRRKDLWKNTNPRRRENSLARSIMERHLGKKFVNGEIVHHINGDFTDHRIDNLQVLPSQSEHMKLHQKQGDIKP